MRRCRFDVWSRRAPRRRISRALFPALLLFAHAARAAPDPPAAENRFGRHSALVLGVERIAGYQEQQFGDATVDSVGFHPLFWSGLGAHLETRSGFTFGALLGATHFTLTTRGTGNSVESLRKTMIWFRPRVGYAGPLPGAFGYWVRLGPTGLLFADSDKKTHKAISAGAEIYAVFHVAPHVGVLLGPNYELQLVADVAASKYGSAGFTLGLIGELY